MGQAMSPFFGIWPDIPAQSLLPLCGIATALLQSVLPIGLGLTPYNWWNCKRCPVDSVLSNHWFDDITLQYFTCRGENQHTFECIFPKQCWDALALPGNHALEVWSCPDFFFCSELMQWHQLDPHFVGIVWRQTWVSKDSLPPQVCVSDDNLVPPGPVYNDIWIKLIHQPIYY